jgi:release factor glutamine methyltransferase
VSARTVAQALADARHSGLDRLEAHWLLMHLLGCERSWLLTHEADALSAAHDAAWTALCARSAAGEPLAYLTGEREFHGLRLLVSPAVLVPRADTETLVDWALDLLAGELADRAHPAVIDLGTGSGAVALAVKHRHGDAQLTALDASPAALAQAEANGTRLALPVRWLLSDWWQAVAGERFDLVLSNPPYIAGDDPHLAELTHEPLQALTPGGDGLEAIRQISAQAGAHLQPGGWLLLEHGWDQSTAVQAVLQAHGFEQVQTRQDLAGHGRCTGGRWPARNSP